MALRISRSLPGTLSRAVRPGGAAVGPLWCKAVEEDHMMRGHGSGGGVAGVGDAVWCATGRGGVCDVAPLPPGGPMPAALAWSTRQGSDDLPGLVGTPPGASWKQAVEALEEDLKRNYTLNVGKAIETLRDDVPLMFRSAPDMDIFADGVVLSDSSGDIVQGKKMYSAIYASLRVARRLTLAQPEVQILSLRYLEWRSEITVRFSITSESPLGLEPLHVDALSVYKLNAEGLIREHRIDDVTRSHLFDSPPILSALPMPNLLWGGGNSRTPVPVPF